MSKHRAQHRMQQHRPNPPKETRMPVNGTPGRPTPGSGPGGNGAPDAESLLLAARQQAAFMQQKLEAVKDSNREGLQELSRLGVGIDPFQVAHLRMDMIVEALARVLGPQGPLWALDANIAFEERMAAAIADVRAQAGQAQLGMGGLLTPAAIREMAKQTGTYGGLGEKK